MHGPCPLQHEAACGDPCNHGLFSGSVEEPEFKFIGAVLAPAALATGCIRWVFTQTVMQKEKMGIVPTIFFFAERDCERFHHGSHL